MFLKVHISNDSSVPDHCRAYALSYPQDNDYVTACDHEHNARCDRCELLLAVLQEIQAALDSIDCSDEERDEMDYEISQSKQSIQAWKAHLLRSVNQDAARHEILQNLDGQSVFLVMDWAMKFLPRKFRESQSDWFGKRGIPWHLTVAMRKNDKAETEMLTFVHCFESCNQDSFTVLAVIDDVFNQLKSIMPEINSVYLRQDNAGCYHSASTLLSVCKVAEKNGIKLERVDFSDPQGGKGSCDRKAATIKSHMRVHVNSGHDIERASQMMVAIESSGGMEGVRVTVSGPPPPAKITPVKWEGVSFINNIAYSEEGMRVWRAYAVGSGKFVPWNNFSQQNVTLSQLNKIADNAKSNVAFVTVKARLRAKQKPSMEELQEDASKLSSPESESDDDTGCHNERKLFYCPEEGCVKSYQRYSFLEQHLISGRHKYALENQTLYDKAMILYATKLEQGAGAVPEVVDDMRIRSVDGSTLPMGWALKSTTVTRKNFTATQKNYLTEMFQAGTRTRQKADPSSVARAMRRAKQSDGSSMFEKSEFLTSQQIAGFFSRLTAKKSCQADTASDDDESVELSTERHIQELANEVLENLAFQHPIMVENHNICEMVSQSKLTKLSLKTLQDICISLEIDVSTISGKRKQPYMSLLEEVVDSCSCKRNK